MTIRALVAELIGSFTLVLAVCGAALFTAPDGGGPLAVALAAGFAVLAMAYAVGHISGGHFNPAVTLGLVAGGRFDAGNAVSYIIAQLIGGIAAALVLAMVLAGKIDPSTPANDFSTISNLYGGRGHYGLASTAVIEAASTALYLIVIMGATSGRAPGGFAPIAIGLAFALLHLVTIPVSGASLNPARSTATAILAGGEAIAQLWVFWVAPIVGGIAGGMISRWLQDD